MRNIISTQKHVKQIPAATPHCRICGYTPRTPKPGQPDYRYEKVLLHFESKHPCEFIEFWIEAEILNQQEAGRDVHCVAHGTFVEQDYSQFILRSLRVA